MSQTLNLSCEDCAKTLWVGQHSSRHGWFLYGRDAQMVAIAAFVNEHIGHAVRFQDCDQVNDDFEDVTDYGD